MGGPVRLPGAGRGGEGQRDQARHAWARSEIDTGLQLQDAVDRGTEARLHVALHEIASGTRAHWDLQSIVLRRSADFAGASRAAREPASSQAARERTSLAG